MKEMDTLTNWVLALDVGKDFRDLGEAAKRQRTGEPCLDMSHYQYAN